MASQRAIAERRAQVLDDLGSVKSILQQRFNLTTEEQPVTPRDAEVGAIQQLENLNALLREIEVATRPADVVESKEEKVPKSTKK